MATASSAIAVEMEAQGRHSLLKRPSIEAAIARAKEKTPAAVAIDLLSKPHSLIVPSDRFKFSTVSVASPTHEAPTSLEQAASIASTVTAD
jgi:hypothetical protein